MIKIMNYSIKSFISLHVLFIILSVSGICGKLAGQHSLFSREFCFFYGIIILLLGFYAVGWQQIIKRLPLSIAFANKAVTVVWGTVWGVLFFEETVSVGKLVGAAMVIVGVVLYASSDREDEHG